MLSEEIHQMVMIMYVYDTMDFTTMCNYNSLIKILKRNVSIDLPLFLEPMLPLMCVIFLYLLS